MNARSLAGSLLAPDSTPERTSTAWAQEADAIADVGGTQAAADHGWAERGECANPGPVECVPGAPALRGRGLEDRQRLGKPLQVGSQSVAGTRGLVGNRKHLEIGDTQMSAEAWRLGAGELGDHPRERPECLLQLRLRRLYEDSHDRDLGWGGRGGGRSLSHGDLPRARREYQADSVGTGVNRLGHIGGGLAATDLDPGPPPRQTSTKLGWGRREGTSLAQLGSGRTPCHVVLLHVYSRNPSATFTALTKATLSSLRIKASPTKKAGIPR